MDLPAIRAAAEDRVTRAKEAIEAAIREDLAGNVQSPERLADLRAEYQDAVHERLIICGDREESPPTGILNQPCDQPVVSEPLACRTSGFITLPIKRAVVDAGQVHKALIGREHKIDCTCGRGVAVVRLERISAVQMPGLGDIKNGNLSVKVRVFSTLIRCEPREQALPVGA